ncbi:MAG: hypothetical protein ACRDSS_11285, partial [Actinocrinis sp.]
MAVRSGQEKGRPAHGRKATGRRLDRIPFRRKLDALVLLPSLAIVGLLAPLVIAQVDAARTWQDAASYMTTTEQVSTLINDLSLEQEDALGVIASIQLVDMTAFDKAIEETDRQRATVLASYGNNPSPKMYRALAEVDALSQPRAAVHSSTINGTILLQSYTSAMQDLSSAMGLAQQASDSNPAAVPEAEL